MRQCRNIIVESLEIQQDIRRRGSASAGECPADLAGIRVNVHPAVSIALPQNIDIFLTKDGNGIQHLLNGLRIGVLPVNRPGIHRNIGVIQVHFIQPQNLLFQAVIAEQDIQMAGNSIDHILVDLRRHVVGEQRLFQCGAVMPHLGRNLFCFDLSGVEGGKGIGKLPVACIERGECRLAHFAVRGAQIHGVIGIGQLHLIALCIADGAEFHI